MLFRAQDLTPEQKSVIETLLGRSLDEGEDVMLKSVRHSKIRPSTLSDEERARVRLEMRAYFEECDRRRAPVSEEEEEAIILEALRSTRPDYQPID